MRLAWLFKEPTHHAATVGRRFIQGTTESTSLIDRPALADSMKLLLAIRGVLQQHARSEPGEATLIIQAANTFD